MKYLLTISYDGGRYCGFQKQNNGISIQQVLTECAEKVFGEGCRITGCSRTDSGVHAVGFKATLECDITSVPLDKIPVALNCHLPPDISVTDALEVDDSFHPRYSAREKEYRYVIDNGRYRDPFLNGRAYRYAKPINIDLMNEASKHLIGEHDFSSYMASGSKITDAIRTIYGIDIIREAQKVIVCIRGNGFLYNMVRIIVGTLLLVSEGKLKPSDIKTITESKDRTNAGPTVPACGLYLFDVRYL